MYLQIHKFFCNIGMQVWGRIQRELCYENKLYLNQLNHNLVSENIWFLVLKIKYKLNKIKIFMKDEHA